MAESKNIGVVYDYKMQPEKEQSISSAISHGCIFTSHGIIKMPKDGGVQPEVRDTLLACQAKLRGPRAKLAPLMRVPREGSEPILPPAVVLDSLILNGMFYSYSDNEDSSQDLDLCVGCGIDCGASLCRWCRFDDGGMR